MTKIKLVSQDCATRNGLKWELGVTNHATGKGRKLYSDGVLHYYDSPELAVFVNPVRGWITNPIAFKVRGRHAVTDGLQSGAKSLTPLRVIELPKPTIVNRIAFGILCSLKVPQSASFRRWAENWLNGSDRTQESAREAAAAAEAVALAAADAATMWAGAAAANAAAAEWAAAEWAAAAAARAAVAVTKVDSVIDFVTIARKAMESK